MSTSFAVVFDHLRPTITADMAQTLDEVVTAYRIAGFASVMVTSDADIAGPTVYDDSLAMRRGSAVKDALVARGVPRDEIMVQSFAVPQSDGSGGTTERIYISFGAGSGQ
jgi:outer membrane protein OmpA-like peptidoglycan-associated protein